MAARLSRLDALATGAHSAYEVAAGIGLPFQPTLRLPGATVAHVAAVASWLRLTARASEAAARTCAVLDGVGLAGAVTHYVAWPSRRIGALPALRPGAEGLPESWTRPYDVLLYGWGLTAAAAIGTRREQRAWALAGLLAIPLIAQASHGKTRWAKQQAVRRRRWWNRAFDPTTPSSLSNPGGKTLGDKTSG